MMTRGRTSSMRKTQVDSENQIGVSLVTDRAVSFDLSEPKSVEAATQTIYDGCQGKQDSCADCKSFNHSMMQAILVMSTELRALSTKIMDMECVLRDCVVVQERWVKSMVDVLHEQEAKVEQNDEIIMKSRGIQCPSTPTKITNQMSTPSSSLPDSESQKEPANVSEKRQKVSLSSQQADNNGGDDQSSTNEKSRKKASIDAPSGTNAFSGQKAAKKQPVPMSTLAETDDVKPKPSAPRKKEKLQDAEIHNSNDRQVLILSDSVLNGVNEHRLGSSYDFNCSIKNCYTTHEIEKSFEEVIKAKGNPQITVLHIGINDLKKSSPQEASKSFVKAAKSIKSICPNTKVVISAVAPVSKDDLAVKSEAFNAINKAELIHEKGFSFMSHENLDALSYRFMNQDGIHPTRDGSSILARNLGRHICSVLWQRVHYSKAKAPYKYKPDGQRYSHGHSQFHTIPLRNRFDPLSNY